MLPKLIMSPIDFSEHSQDALNTASELASRLGAEILLVHVVPAMPKLPSAETIFKEREYEEELHKDAEKRLQQMAQTLSASGIKARTTIGIANDVSMELLRIAEQENVDLIVIATHGMTGWRKLSMGSVAEKVVKLAECPVLVTRIPADKTQDNEKSKSVAVSD